MSRKTVFKPIDAVTLGAAGSYTTIWTPDSGNRFAMHGYHLSSANTQVLKMKDGTTVFVVIPPPDGSSVGAASTDADLSIPYVSSAANNALSITSGVNSDTINGFVYGEED